MKFWHGILFACSILSLTSGVKTVHAQSYTLQAALASDQAFQSRVRIAGFVAAIAIANESTNVNNHAARVQFAQQFVQNADAFVSKLAYAVAADVTIGSSATDAVLQTRVNAIWNTFSGT